MRGAACGAGDERMKQNMKNQALQQVQETEDVRAKGVSKASYRRTTSS